ncbi:MAG: AI-2E family transporter [Nitrospira sp.]|nr:AI-2E family transporter [Nitrospira sp.]
MQDHRHDERESTVRLIRLGFLIALGALFLAIFSPFFSIMAWAAILCYALYPLYRLLLRATGRRQTVSALLMCLVLMIGLILPLVSVSFLIGEETARTYTASANRVEQGATWEDFLPGRWRDHPLISLTVERLNELERRTGTDLRSLMADNLTEMGKGLVEQLGNLATNVLIGGLKLLFIALCSFFFFRDGAALLAWVQDILPFSHERQHVALRRFDEVVTGSIYGNALVALLIGSVGGLAFFTVGFHSPFLWGAVIGMLAYLPIPGVSLVWLPGALYLFFEAAYLKTAILCGAGAAIIFLDYAVRNLLVAKRVQLHPLLVILSVLGGIKLFGLLGLVAGPLTVAMGRTVLDMYRLEQSGSGSTTPKSSSPRPQDM